MRIRISIKKIEQILAFTKGFGFKKLLGPYFNINAYIESLLVLIFGPNFKYFLIFNEEFGSRKCLVIFTINSYKITFFYIIFQISGFSHTLDSFWPKSMVHLACTEKFRFRKRLLLFFVQILTKLHFFTFYSNSFDFPILLGPL